MSKVSTYILICLVAIGFLTACSTKKNKFANRAYHNTNANYNGFFYAKESIKKGEEKIAANKDLDWEEILPIFIIPTDDEAKKVYPEMDRAIEKLSKVIEWHSIKIKGKEYNKWVDDSYLLIGVAHFYKRKFTDAEKTLKFVSENYKDEKQADTRLAAYTWLALTYMEQERLGNARNVFLSVDNKLLAKNPKKNRWRYHAAYAMYYYERNAFSSAVGEIENAIAASTSKKQKARFYFIIGQLFEKDGNAKKAIENYKIAAKMANTNELKFYSMLRQALSADVSYGFDEVRALLQDLLDEEKYEIYYDQVYWALGQSYFKEKEDSTAIEYLKKSVAVSQGNRRQKIKSFRKLADWHFEQRIYRPASSYYDSTLVYLPPDHEDYVALEIKSGTLKELVTHMDMAQHQDSIQRVVAKEPAELDKFLAELVRRFEKEEEERRLQAELEAAIEARKSSGNQFAKKSGAWYFYNPNTVSGGRADFSRRWGDREDEDFWRVKSISPQSNNMAFQNNDPEASKGEPAALLEEDIVAVAPKAIAGIERPVETKGRVPTFEELMLGLPTNDSLMDTSRAMMQQALYKAGILFKEYLNDIDYAVESFMEIVDNFDDGTYFLASHYQLYRLFIAKEKAGSYFTTNFKFTSGWWKDVILEDYPDSEYAYLILNPNALEEGERKRLAELEQYEDIYKRYKQRQYLPLITEIKYIIDNQPTNHLIQKYYLLRAMCIGYVAHPSTDALEEKLVEIVSLYPGSEEAKTAQRLIALINQSESGPLVPQAQEANFKFNAQEMHYFAVIIPANESDVNNLKFKVSDFNMEYFRNQSLKVSVNFITKQDQVLLVKSFANADAGIDYLATFNSNTDKVKFIKDKNYQYFLISKSNYSSLFRNKELEEYISFFKKTYK
ncbi:MAG: type IX secretion system periplasmic lipoprotein PorW/SprE [Luteibaculaceae bacterium]